ncbi:ATP-grasp fold amidoligase family protein [Parabacteroides sp. ZJ-118]|uniref:ATP-grasp fold amidoligase family protein n=1 Tax=Parabacteroides sp. ZJ-118 TaxID=2709398 RepID=UPI0013E9AC8D|nr:ATP-grasp fold amidoligase family protein [Parabacteroides sp. ZJ-118]
MNYKQIIKSRSLRLNILRLLSWVPDKWMIPLQYRIHTGRKLNLKNPTRFTEKLQLYKLYYRNPLMLRCTDKYEVRSVIEEMGYGDILIPLIGVYNSPEEIPLNNLPDEFVAKTTDGGGGQQVFICRDKSKLDRVAFLHQLHEWMAMPKTKPAGREWAYENGYPRRIIIEKLIKTCETKDLPDYKFYCFDGKPVYCQLIGDRSTKETIDFYDMDWNHMPFRGLNPDCENAVDIAPPPKNFERLKTIAARLSKEYPFVRVDLYSVGDEAYFGELTFYPASGFGHFTPDKWDEKLGELIDTENLRKTAGGG